MEQSRNYAVLAAVWGLVTTLVAGSDPPPAVFLSQGEQVVALRGENIVFQCVSQNTLVGQDIIWKKKGGLTLAMGIKVFDRSGRVSAEIRDDVDNDGTRKTHRLIINSVKVADEGVYVCEIAGNAEQLEHTLQVNIPANIDRTKQEGDVRAQLEESIRLICPATGKPDPDITWRRDDQSLPNGERFHRGEILDLENLGRLDSGLYICIASNGAGQPDTMEVKVHVEYAPEVTIAEEMIHTGPGQNVVIECNFSAYPKAEVIWKHNDSDIDFDLRSDRNTETIHHQGVDQWRINIGKVRPEDCGVYTCIGVNKLGNATASVLVSALPHSLRITSEPEGRYSDQYTLKWNVQTLAQLVEFHLRFKRVNDSVETEFLNTSIPAPLNHEVPYHTQQYTFTNLTPNSSYSLQLRARNTFGHSEWTDLYYFITAEPGKEAPLTTSTAKPQHESYMTEEATDAKSMQGGASQTTVSTTSVFTLLVLLCLLQ